jgi:hypothetical protein
MSKGGGGGGPSEQTVIQSNLPEYAEPFYRSLLARVGYESALPYEAYPGQRLAYFSPAEQEAQRRFEQLGVSGTPDELLAAGDIAAQVGQGNPFAATMLGGQYQAKDAALSRFQAGIGALSDAERLNLQRLQANEAARQQQAQLAQGAFGQLLSADQQRLAAAGMMGDFVSQRQAMELERLRQMQASGQIERELMQRGLDIGYTDFLRQQAFPKEQLSFYSSMLQGVPIAPGQVSQSYGITPSTTQQLLGSGIAGVGLYNALGLGR